jgi:hypothetical protein
MTGPVSLIPEARLRWIVFAMASAAFWVSFFHRVTRCRNIRAGQP